MFTKQNKRAKFLYSFLVFVFIFGFFNFYTRIVQAQTVGSGSVTVTIPTGFTTGSVVVTVSGTGATSGSTTFTLVTANTSVPGVCGTANGKTYPSTATGYGTDSQCASGNASSPAFPLQNGSTSWTCSGANGGATSPTCSASKSAVAVASGSISANPTTCTLPCSGGSVLTWSTTGVTVANVYVNGVPMTGGTSGSTTIPGSWISTSPLTFTLYDDSSGFHTALGSATVTGQTAPTCSPLDLLSTCTSDANSCGMRNSATYTCTNGVLTCPAVAPSNVSCTVNPPRCGDAQNSYGDVSGTLCWDGTASNGADHGTGNDYYYSWSCSNALGSVNCSNGSINDTPEPPPACSTNGCASGSAYNVIHSGSGWFRLGCMNNQQQTVSCQNPAHLCGATLGSCQPNDYVYDSQFNWSAYNLGQNLQTQIDNGTLAPGTAWVCGIGQYSCNPNTQDCNDKNNWDNTPGGQGALTCYVQPTGLLTASPTSIYTGESSTLTWSSTYATSCTGTNFNTGGAKSGSALVKPASTITYSITCGSATATATVTVKHKPAVIEG